jgi:hypothetical protein
MQTIISMKKTRKGYTSIKGKKDREEELTKEGMVLKSVFSYVWSDVRDGLE